ncbi:MAG TPA: hypothetical protein VMS60_15135 [Solirubrobacterales bacterium]|nr:hypothetical protein [Solirubrobacterales bacterium]
MVPDSGTKYDLKAREKDYVLRRWEEDRAIVDREDRWGQMGSETEAMKRRAESYLRKRTRSALAGVDQLLAET